MRTKVVASLLACISTAICVRSHHQVPLKPASSSTNHLQLTAITHSDIPPHDSRIQCLNITSNAFHTYPTVGKSLFLSPVANLTYVVLPPRSGEGWHKPPHPMFFILLSGKARVVTPSTEEEISIEPGGPNQLLLALDTLGRGHQTFYPGDEPTVALRVPLA